MRAFGGKGKGENHPTLGEAGQVSEHSLCAKHGAGLRVYTHGSEPSPASSLNLGLPAAAGETI